ncbi:hypothetical protein MRQ36_29230 [Micromonospora sp. R77]|uniref:hypothetical protein n=1 Tax=Micromonospora sp. R77 TaxID=2925836 RepID=UPI001F600796|nr:hypothetical protein [Micromonospora sp. R77]MCI4066418.1 hypothetical protein [Micromonospora sp. R77]
MAQYVVTITPVVGDGGPEEESSRTTMRICAEDGQVFIKELTVRVAEDARLGPGDLLQVDLDLLMQAFAVKRPTTEGAQPSTREAARPHHAVTTAVSPNSGPVAAPPTRTDRAYRRMPDPAELKDIYLFNRTITGVAQHYGVPTHTAQGWISRLRRKGVIPSNK